MRFTQELGLFAEFRENLAGDMASHVERDRPPLCDSSRGAMSATSKCTGDRALTCLLHGLWNVELFCCLSSQN